MKAKTLNILTLFILIGCTSMTKNFLTTTDNYKLDYNLVQKPEENNFLLLHQLNMNKDSYKKLQQELPGTSLAITFRGHQGSDGDWHEFTEEDFAKLLLDAKAGLDKLNTNNVVVIGASIGANTALNIANTDSRISKVILLSPGLIYRGMNTTTAATQIKKPTLIIVSKEDTYSSESSNELNNILLNNELLTLENSGHGTTMLLNQKTTQKIKEFIKN